MIEVRLSFIKKQMREVRKMQRYRPEIEKQMKKFYESLNEKDRRRYAGLEALKMGHGGRSYIAKVLGCSRNTVRQGASEVSDLSQKEVEGQIDQKPKKNKQSKKKRGGYG